MNRSKQSARVFVDGSLCTEACAWVAGIGELVGELVRMGELVGGRFAEDGELDTSWFMSSTRRFVPTFKGENGDDEGEVGGGVVGGVEASGTDTETGTAMGSEETCA